MAFKFSPVVVAVFIINFITFITAEHKNCYNYDVITRETGTKHREIYENCGITGYNAVNENRKLQCVAGRFRLVNDDGSIHGKKLRTVLREYTYPEHLRDVMRMAGKSLKDPEHFLTLFAQGTYNICPEDEIYGKSGDDE